MKPEQMNTDLSPEEYLRDPCRASSLPYWKAKQTEVPSGIRILREDAFRAKACRGRDEPYFRLIRRTEGIIRPELPAGFEPAVCGLAEYAEHIGRCYREEGVTAEELAGWTAHPVYDPELWVAVRETDSGQIAATGIAEADRSIGEGILEWIQVSPEYRRRGLGQYVVRELLYRMRDKAQFVTVSGRMNNPDNPYGLYLSCGFADPVIWHVVRTE